MKIAFIGYGSMARALSKRWADKHEVFIGGRNAERAAELAREINAAGSGSSADAVSFGEAVVIATPGTAVESAIESVGAAAFSGKIIIDINNPVSIPEDPANMATADYLPQVFDEGSLAERIATLAPGAHVVKAFNTCHASVWEMDPPEFDGRPLAGLYCGNDDDAKKAVAGLIADLGCDPVDVGELKYARLLEAVASMVIKFLFSGRDLKTVFNLIQPESEPI